MGAINYLVKPVRMQECKAFTTKMKKQKLLNEDKANLQGLDKYEFIRPIGKGTEGIVSLQRNIIDGEEYAIKEIDMTFYNDRQKQQVQNEREFLKVL